MGISTKNIFSIILITSVVFVLFLSSPVYKIISGKGNHRFSLLEGMTTSEASSLGITGDGSSNNPYIIPQKLIVRPANGNWKQMIQNEDKTEIGISGWSIDDQFMGTGGPNFIGDQYRYFAEWWLAKYNPQADASIFFAASVRGNNYSNSASDYGLYKFAITQKNNDGSINYSGTFNNKGWSWTSPALSPAPTPIVSPVAAAASSPVSSARSVKELLNEKCPLSGSETRDGIVYINQTNSATRDNYLFSGCKESNTCDSDSSKIDPISKNILDSIPSKGFCGAWDLGDYGWDSNNNIWIEKKFPSPTPDKKAEFESRKCNSASTRDGNCYPACVPVSGGKVVGPPYEIYGGTDNARGPDGLPFDMRSANYFYERPVGRLDSGGKYYPITDESMTSIKYGSDTDCTQKPEPPKPKPTPSGPCDPSCRKVKDPRFAGDACKLDKSIDKIVCAACPLVDGEIKCNNYMAMCDGCPDVLRAKFDPNKPYPDPEPKEKPFTPTECETNCEKPGVEIFKNYLNMFRDGSGFDDGSCQIVGRNLVKCRPVRKGVSAGAGASANANGGMKPIPAPDQCVLCEEENLQWYAEFDRKWDNYAKQNDYVNVKLVDGPQRQRRRGASYGPSDGSGGINGGSGGRGGQGGENWERWDGGDSTNGAGWRGSRGSCGDGGWYQSMNDMKNKSFQVATENNESSQQQAYIESLKMQLNKINYEYTTRKADLNNMKMRIDKQISACQNAKSKLSDAMRSSVSDDMNKNAAITMKEKIDANVKMRNIDMLQQNVKSACDNANQMSNTYNTAMKQLGDIDMRRQALIEKIVIATNKITDNKTTININLGSGMGDCGDRIGCGTGMQYNNMYTNDYFKPQRISDMVNYNYNNIPMPYQDIISL